MDMNKMRCFRDRITKEKSSQVIMFNKLFNGNGIKKMILINVTRIEIISTRGSTLPSRFSVGYFDSFYNCVSKIVR